MTGRNGNYEESVSPGEDAGDRLRGAFRSTATQNILVGPLHPVGPTINVACSLPAKIETLPALHRTDILLALVDQRSPSSINATLILPTKSNLNATSLLGGKLGKVLDPVANFRTTVLTAAHNGDLPEVARLLSIIDDAEEDVV